MEKKKLVPTESLTRDLPFEQRLYRKHSMTDSFDKWTTKKSPVLTSLSTVQSPQSTTEFLLGDAQNMVITNPLFDQVEIHVDMTEDNNHKN